MLKVKVASLVGTVRKLTDKATALVSGDLPPDLILNRIAASANFETAAGRRPWRRTT